MRDYHIHTKLCGHAYREMEEYVETAIDRGFTEICFTDHIPFPDSYDRAHRMGMDDLGFYLEEVERLKGTFPGITILTGIEADYMDRYRDYLAEFFKEYSFDLVIMAIHFIDHWPDGNWTFKYDFPDRTMKEIYHDYFTFMNRGLETGFFDVLAHMDLIKRPGYPVLKTNRDDVEMILGTLKKQNMAIEINTSGFRREIAEPYPALEVIELAADMVFPSPLLPMPIYPTTWVTSSAT